MNLVEWLKHIMVGFGAAWVMWLMLGLSVISVAIMLERGWFFWSIRDDLVTLQRDLRNALRESIEKAQKRMEASPSAEAAVVLAGLAEAENGPAAAEEAMTGALALQRMKLEKRLAYLGTLGNNAPFIGLFGTVIGVVQAFAELAKAPVGGAATSQIAPQATVMASIGEALVATAVGLIVAIPAVAGNNFFQRVIRATVANTDALTHTLLAHLKAQPAYRAPVFKEEEPAPAAKGKGNAKKAEKKADAEEAE
ncbi:MAG: MotA/TolQ/ExbB proton channel family protein [Polyangiaceae bacterium]